MSKPIVLLVHGYNGSPKIFEYFRDVLRRDGYEVVIPNFPVREEITLDRYLNVFDEYSDKINENTIVVAHSVGNILTLKYLCLNNIFIQGYISLAGFGEPFMTEGRDDLNKVLAPLRLTNAEKDKLPRLIGKSYSIYSDNDHIVPFQLLQEYPKIIGAKAIMVPGIGHMGSKSGLEKLPEVVELVSECFDMSR